MLEEQPARPECRQSAVVLDYGVDEAQLGSGDLQLGGSVIRIAIPWRFDEGTCLEVTLKQQRSGELVDAETMVIDSRQCPQRCNRYHTTLLVLRTLARGGDCECAEIEPQLCALLAG